MATDVDTRSAPAMRVKVPWPVALCGETAGVLPDVPEPAAELARPSTAMAVMTETALTRVARRPDDMVAVPPRNGPHLDNLRANPNRRHHRVLKSVAHASTARAPSAGRGAASGECRDRGQSA